MVLRTSFHDDVDSSVTCVSDAADGISTLVRGPENPVVQRVFRRETGLSPAKADATGPTQSRGRTAINHNVQIAWVKDAWSPYPIRSRISPTDNADASRYSLAFEIRTV